MPCMSAATVISCVFLVTLFSTRADSRATRNLPPIIEKLVQKWAPLVFLAPGEKFFPSGVPEFLESILPVPRYGKGEHFSYDQLNDVSHSKGLPKGAASESWSLVTREDVGFLLKNTSSFLYGRNPMFHPVPVYALIVPCDQRNTSDNYILDDVKNHGSFTGYPSFHVTYWMFYPYNQGKTVCTVDMGRFGAWPIPKLNNFCYGALKEFGNHVGDWEHMTLHFEGSYLPKKMYVSVHDVGAIYKFENGEFQYERREIRKSILQRPSFPAKIKLSTPGNHPVLFAARGSHGLWAAPGKHRFVRIPRLYDNSGFGIPWQTWKKLIFLHTNSQTERNWLQYRGRWGNAKSNCHPVSSLGLHICELSDGPTGIPSKKQSLQCS